MDRDEKLIKQYLSQKIGLDRVEGGSGCPCEEVLLEYLNADLPEPASQALEHHLAGCNFCLGQLNIAFEARSWRRRAKFVPTGLVVKTKARLGIVEPPNNNKRRINRRRLFMMGTVFFFVLSFIIPSYFLQFLVASLILGIRWSFESESGHTMIMILDSWRRHARDKDEEISRRLKNRR